MEIKLWIRAARKKADLTQEQLGEKLGVTKANVSSWETGRHKPSYEQIQRIAALSKLPLPGTEENQPINFGKPIGAQLEEMLQESGLDAAAFADRLGIDARRVLGWLHGESAGVSDAVAIQNEFGYSVGWILTGSGTKRIAPPAAEEPQPEIEVDPLTLSPYSYDYQPKPVGKWRGLSVMGMAQLGDNGFWADVEYAVGHGDGYVDWPTTDPNAYALQCDGESMLPRIRPGEFVIIEPGNPIQPGDEVMVRSTDGRVMVKEFLYKANGRCHLASVNAAHGRISIPIEAIEKMHYVSGIAKPSKWRPD